eukprot:gnl/Dysnectes_brevis/9349_a17293_241.p1 GENE.gnl/Dysnectes_brevis/9349_a17293_241~~gnl/Dysnectes_brevis/9349_a17293_241.p1  ORF type:complete len:323 (+),score=82.00 gnl/Dysnectes_brevis/9349_a17293_241:285-1253(+)
MDLDATNGFMVVGSSLCQGNGVVFIYSYDPSLDEWSLYESFQLSDFISDFEPYKIGAGLVIDNGLIVVNSFSYAQGDYNLFTLTMDDTGSFLNSPFFLTATNTYGNHYGSIYTTDGFIFVSESGNDVLVWNTNAADWPRANSHEKWDAHTDHSIWYSSEFGSSMTSSTQDDGSILLLISDSTAYPSNCDYGDGMVYAYMYDPAVEGWSYHPELAFRQPGYCDNTFAHFGARLYMTPDAKHLVVSKFYDNAAWEAETYLYENRGDNTFKLVRHAPSEVSYTYEFGTGVSILGSYWYVANPIAEYMGDGGSSKAGALFVYELPL